MDNSNLSASNLNISNTDDYGIFTNNNSTLTLNNSSIADTTLHATRHNTSTLNGNGNVISGTVGGAVCNDLGGNSGSINYDDVQGNGPAICP